MGGVEVDRAPNLDLCLAEVPLPQPSDHSESQVRLYQEVVDSKRVQCSRFGAGKRLARRDRAGHPQHAVRIR